MEDARIKAQKDAQGWASVMAGNVYRHFKGGLYVVQVCKRGQYATDADCVQNDLRTEETGRETVRRKKEKPIAAGDAVIVRRRCADGGARPAWGKVVFAANGGRFYVVNVELVPCAFRHEVMMMRETFWPEDVERARIEG